MKTIEDIALEVLNVDAAVQLLYAFNSVGKTRLSIAYKNATKTKDGKHTGIYYNAYSEDLFVWDNDIKKDETNVQLTILPSSLNELHSDLNESAIHAKLKPYRPNFDFRFVMHKDPELGIKSISFFLANKPSGDISTIKISRGEERVFVWCFFLAMMEVESWTENRKHHIFIDDPISSLDDHNIFVTVSTLYDLIEKHFDERKIIITTHHVGMFSILNDWLKKGEKSDKYKPETKAWTRILSIKHGELSLETLRKDVFLYHLRILQLLEQAQKDNKVRAYHLVLLRQVLESVSSFLGVGRINYALKRIGFEDKEKIARIVNVLAHKRAYYYESNYLSADSQSLFVEILENLNNTYGFVTHAS